MTAQQPLNLNSVAENFDVSRPAISKHIKILTECGLVVIRQQGRERFCEAQLHKLNEVTEWIEQHRVLWTSKLDALGNFLNKRAPKTTKRQLAKKTKRK
jgi:DNA-binding transcriptional ArsR family regulator